MLSAMTMNGWVPGAGDNDWLGWVCTIAYFLSAGACFFAWRVERRAGQRRPMLWLSLCVLLVLLGINKQLDLQLFIARIGKDVVTHEGWRGKWKLLNELFLAANGLAALIAFLILLRYVGGAWRKYRAPLAGLICLGVFVLLRAGMNVPRIEAINMKFYTALHVMELMTVLCIGASAISCCLLAREVARGSEGKTASELAD